MQLPSDTDKAKFVISTLSPTQKSVILEIGRTGGLRYLPNGQYIAYICPVLQRKIKPTLSTINKLRNYNVLNRVNHDLTPIGFIVFGCLNGEIL